MHFDLSDHYRPLDSIIHHLDPRVKVVTALAVILGVSLTPQGAWSAFGAYLVLLVLLSTISGLGPFFTLRRSFVALPFLLVALPLPFTTPGETLFTLPGLEWAASLEGTIMFASVLLRTWLAVQAAIWMTAVTRFPDVLWALSALRLPNSLVAVIGFMYRYLFVMADEALRMLRARSARAPHVPGGSRPSVVWQGRVAGAMVGSLFLRALDRSERIYAAMVSRGYDGHMRTMQHFQMRASDWAILLVIFVAAAAPVLFLRFG
ncbi:MAG: cobalt ECF transporter T component CbiQ [Anaerolineales bacterium]